MRLFPKNYLGAEDEEQLREVERKVSVIGYSRLIRKIRKKRKTVESDHLLIRQCIERITTLTDRLDSLAF